MVLEFVVGAAVGGGAVFAVKKKDELAKKKDVPRRKMDSKKLAAVLTEEERQIADSIANSKHDVAKEGPINWQNANYQGINDCLFFGKEHPDYVPQPMRVRPTGIAESALDYVGHTPLIRFSRLSQYLGLPSGVDLMGKCEGFSIGGSVKDRIALKMIEDAEKAGKIKPGDVLIEPTSGNTGIGLCMAGAIKGYKVIITMPLKMSGEKLNTMKALGAEIYRTPTEAFWKDDNSHIALALRLQKQIPNAHILDQYKNVANPMAHYENTAEEILQQTGGKIDYMVMTAGTGGTMTGIARKLKEKCPNVKIIAVDPMGSILALPESLNDENKLKPYAVEGIGYDFIPTVCDHATPDLWVKTKDEESFQMSRTVIRTEGVLVGGSCGSCVVGALKAIKQLNITEGRVVCLLSDSVRNYMSKFLDDEWMVKNGFSTDLYPAGK